MNRPFTTHTLLQKAGACKDRYDFLKTWAGDRGENAPIYLSEIVEQNGIEDAVWAFRALSNIGDFKPLFVEFAIWNAEQVLANYEGLNPNDTRPRDAIEAARVVLGNDCEENRSAAQSAAESAARLEHLKKAAERLRARLAQLQQEAN